MSHFLQKFRFPVTREHVTLLKTFTITKLSVRETKLSSPERPRELYKESAACLITKASNSSHFHFPLIFCSLLYQPVSHLRNLKKDAFSAESLYHKDSNMFRPASSSGVSIQKQVKRASKKHEKLGTSTRGITVRRKKRGETPARIRVDFLPILSFSWHGTFPEFLSLSGDRF